MTRPATRSSRLENRSVGQCAGRAAAWLVAAAAILALGACSSMFPNRFQPGISLDEVRASGANPTAEYPLQGGGKRLEFVLGAYAKQTYMLDFDAAGKLVSNQQVLTNANLATITPGMSSQEVLVRFGHPAKVDVVARPQPLRVWDYRFADGDCEWYRVSIGDDDQVFESGRSWDPACDGPNGRD